MTCYLFLLLKGFMFYTRSTVGLRLSSATGSELKMALYVTFKKSPLLDHVRLLLVVYYLVGGSSRSQRSVRVRYCIVAGNSG